MSDFVEGMPRRVRLDPDYNGWGDQVVGWAEGNGVEDMAEWPVYIHAAEVEALRKENERMRAFAHYVETVTATGDGLNAETTIILHQHAGAAAQEGKE